MASDHRTGQDEATLTTERQRSFTVKSIFFGLAGACLLAGGGFFNDSYLGQTPIIGNFLPPGPFALLLLLALTWNPTIGRWARLRFSTGELATVLALMLMCSWLPTSGFFRYFQRAVAMPQVQADTRPEWRKYDILGHMPAELFPYGGSVEAQALALALTDERTALASGSLDEPLAKAGTDRPAYVVALDLAGLVPPRQFAVDPASARAPTELTLQREAGRDPRRWAAAGDLLKGLPGTLKPDAGTPAAWNLAYGRLVEGQARHLTPERRKAWESTYTGMVQGLPVGDETLPLSGLPVQGWLSALVYWLPLVACFALCVLALSLVLHKQWSQHEQLTYPIATVATALVARSHGSLVSDVFRSRLFWCALIPVIAIHGLDYLGAWFPGRVPTIPLVWGMQSLLSEKLPSLGQSGGSSGLGLGAIYFSVIGLAYFIGAEMSLSLGLSGIVLVVFSLGYYHQTGSTVDTGSARSGAYLGYALILLYTGRHYYWAVLAKAFGAKGGAEGEHHEPVWAARLLILGVAGLVAILVGAFRLDWLVAVVYVMTLLAFFMVFSRIVCETGVPFLQAGWQPAQLLGNLLGVGAIGPGPLVMISYLGTILSQDPRECLMPFASNALKLAENTGVRRLRLVLLGFGTIILALGVGLVATSWGLYNFGSGRDGYAQSVAAANLDDAARGVTTLVDTGRYEASAQATGLAKIPLIAENTGRGKQLGWIAFGILAVASFSLMRFRFAWFPLHPVLFLFWDTYPAMYMWFSFLVGWAAKGLVVRFGGGRIYQDLKPLFLGLIAGELVAVVGILGTGWIYWLVTGVLPKSMSVFPG